MKIALGCDEAGLSLKNTILRMLDDKGYETADFGCYDERPVLYPDIGFAVAQAVERGEYERGILICGTGIGMSISANKVKGIRAAVCHDPFSTERSRKSNDAQIMCMGARIIGEELAKYLVNIWMGSDFEGGGSTAKVDKIKAFEETHD